MLPTLEMNFLVSNHKKPDLCCETSKNNLGSSVE